MQTWYKNTVVDMKEILWIFITSGVRLSRALQSVNNVNHSLFTFLELLLLHVWYQMGFVFVWKITIVINIDCKWNIIYLYFLNFMYTISFFLKLLWLLLWHIYSYLMCRNNRFKVRIEHVLMTPESRILVSKCLFVVCNMFSALQILIQCSMQTYFCLTQDTFSYIQYL